MFIIIGCFLGIWNSFWLGVGVRWDEGIGLNCIWSFKVTIFVILFFDSLDRDDVFSLRIEWSKSLLWLSNVRVMFDLGLRRDLVKL